MPPNRPNASAIRRTPAAEPATQRPSTAKVFWSGRSQAVRLPKEFRLSSAVVLIHREGARIVLEPPAHELDANGWPKGFWTHLATVGDDFELGDRDPPHERPEPLGEG